MFYTIYTQKVKLILKLNFNPNFELQSCDLSVLNLIHY